MPPLCWWLRDSISRASFLLTAAYLVRDRDVKLRMYPGIAPMLVLPFIFLLQETHPRYHSAGNVAGAFDGFGVAFSGAYMGLIPYLALKMIRYSQQWQASDLFRVAPMAVPAALCHGARRAILCFLTLPILLVFSVLVYVLGQGSSHLPLLIPGIIALPIYSLIPCVGGKAVPLSLPTESAKAAGRGLSMMGVMATSAVLAAASTLAWSQGVFKWFLIVETIATLGIYTALRVWLARARWAPIE
jgi:ABC-2 type transport system permease protein